LRTLSIGPPRPFESDLATTAPANPASAAPPASSGVLARFAASPTLFATDPTLLAPLAAVSLTVSPTDPALLWPFRDPERLLPERDVDLARVLFDDDERPRDEEERERAVVELRELELFREFDALRPLDAAFVLLPLPPEPFLDVLLERLDVLRRRLVLAFACAICSSSVRVLFHARFPYRV
jgi:hypothetical protein